MTYLNKIFLYIFLIVQVFYFRIWAIEVPKLSGPVVDRAQLLEISQIQELSYRLAQIRSEGGPQLQLLTLESLSGESIEQVAIQVFDQWKLGDEKKDDGVLFIISKNDRKLRIEVGRGLEGAIPDAVAKRIISGLTSPLFKNGQIYSGIVLTFEALNEASKLEQSGEIFNLDRFKEKILKSDSHLLSKRDQKVLASSLGEGSGKKSLSLGFIVLFLAGLWFIIFLISPTLALSLLFNILFSSGSSSRGHGGSWSGGGGSSSGGGASGDW